VVLEIIIGTMEELFKNMPKGGKIPKEAMEFAKKMGADFDGMEAEAEDLWGMLNDMSERSEYEYSEFVKEQMDLAKEEEESEKNGTGFKGKFFRPESGLSFYTMTIGNDGLKVRVLDKTNSPSGKKMHINLVQHKAVELPKDHYGNVVTDERRFDAGGLEIPLAVGPVRELGENGEEMVLDVVVHPSIVKHCSTHNMFLDQVATLAIDTIMAENEMKLQNKWKMNSQVYVGGRGANKSSPALFPVDPQAYKEEQEKKKKKQNEPVLGLSNPKSMLDAVLSSRDNKDDSNTNTNDAIPSMIGGGGNNDLGIFKIAGIGSNTSPSQPQKSSSKIVDVDDILASTKLGGDMSQSQQHKNSSSSPSSSSDKPAKSIIKKGFFDDSSNKKESIYDNTGSGEGSGGAKGGTYAKFMSRCQVVDPANNTVQQPTHPAPFGSTKSDDKDKSAVSKAVPAPATSVPKKGEGERKKVSLPGRGELDAMEVLARSVDRDWDKGNDVDMKELEAGRMDSMLSDMAKVLEGVGGNGNSMDGLDASLFANFASKASDVVKNNNETKKEENENKNTNVKYSPSITVRSSFPSENTVIVQEQNDGTHRKLSVKIHELYGMTSMNDANVNLQVSEKQIIFSTGPNAIAQISGPFKLDPESTIASFKKKKGVLKIEVNIS